jgi:N-acetylneuraminic acid mutarotase
MLILSIMVSVDAFAQEDTWTKKADFGGGVRYAGVGFSIGNKAYIGTGSGVEGNNAAIKNDFWEYDPVSNTWSQKANFAGGVRFYATV